MTKAKGMPPEKAEAFVDRIRNIAIEINNLMDSYREETIRRVANGELTQDEATEMLTHIYESAFQELLRANPKEEL